MVVNGTAPDDCCPQMKKLSTNATPNTTEGNSMAVASAVRFQFCPLNVLYRRAPLKPPITLWVQGERGMSICRLNTVVLSLSLIQTHPKKTKRRMAAVRREPLDAGESMPNMAKTMLDAAMPNS